MEQQWGVLNTGMCYYGLDLSCVPCSVLGGGEGGGGEREEGKKEE